MKVGSWFLCLEKKVKVERKFDQRKENDCWLEKKKLAYSSLKLKGESECMKQIVGVKEY